MKKTLLSIASLSIFVFATQVFLTSSSNGRAFAANSGNTGAPGETTTCRSCHGTGFGTTVSIVIKDAQGNAITSYTPGAVYDAEFTVNATGASRYGFQMVSLDSSNTAVNGFSSPDTNTRLVALANGRQYAEHAGKSTTNSFSTQWTAPTIGTGTVTFYGGGAAVNNNGSTGGDGGNVTSINLTENPTNTPCVADFNVQTINLSASFQDISFTSPGAISYFWDFGDGNTSTQQYPINNYTSAGTYTTCLIINDPTGNCTDTTCKSVTVTSPVNSTPCVADFGVVTNNLTASFTDSSSTPPSSAIAYAWDFGDGNSSGLQNPTHTYTSSGTYSTCLIINDSNSNCSDSICYFVSVTAPAVPCNANFSYSTNSNNSVTFTDNTTIPSGQLVAWSWDFGDNLGTSTLQNPTYNYTNTGAYVVTLIVTDAVGVTCSFSDTVFVNTCTANFGSQAGSNGVVNFTNLSNPINNKVVFDWNFGDGSPTVFTTNPTHTYASSGTYTVLLNMYDSTGNCSATYSDSVLVQIGNPSSCNAAFTKAKDSSVAFGVILYNTSSSFASHYYSWDFGDGIIGSGRTPIHQYQSFGSYAVCLTITDTVLNCTSTYCDTVGMDSLGNLKSGFGLRVQNPTAVGLTEVDDLTNINLYPNPTKNNISLDLRGVASSVNIRIMDISGRVVLEQFNQNPGTVKNIELSNLQSGLYFMVLNNGASQKIKKFIKQ